MNDPYQVLGISRGASEEEIKKAYNNLMNELIKSVENTETN